MEIYVGDNGEAFGIGNPWFIIKSQTGLKILVDTPNDPSRFNKAYEPEYVWLTHLDGDHAGGLKRIIQYRSFHRKRTTIFCPKGAEKILRPLIDGIDDIIPKFPLLYKIVEVKHGDTFQLGGLTLRARRAIHQEKCLGLIVEEGGHKVLITGDHYYDPEFLNQLLEEGKITKKEYEDLTNYDFDLIFHDCGSAPCHTPPEILQKLPKEVREKIIAYHTNEKILGLKVAKPGETYEVPPRKTKP